MFKLLISWVLLFSLSTAKEKQCDPVSHQTLGFDKFEERWIESTFIPSKTNKLTYLNSIDGEKFYSVPANSKLWFVAPSNAKFRFKVHKENLPLKDNIRVYSGNSTGLLKEISNLNVINGRTYEVPHHFDGLRIILVEIKNKEQLISFFESYKIPIPTGEPFKSTKEFCRSSKTNDIKFKKTNRNRKSIRNYITKDSEVFYSADYAKPLEFEVKQPGEFMIDFKMPLNHKSNQRSYRNWIELYQDSKFKELIWFEQATIENQLNYVHNSSRVYTKNQKFRIKNLEKNSIFQIRPFLPTQVKVTFDNHKLITKKINSKFIDYDRNSIAKNELQRVRHLVVNNAKLNRPPSSFQNNLYTTQKLKQNYFKNLETKEINTLVSGVYGRFQDIPPLNNHQNKKTFVFDTRSMVDSRLSSPQMLAPKTYLKNFKSIKETVLTKISSEKKLTFKLEDSTNKKPIRVIAAGAAGSLTLITDSGQKVILHKPTLPLNLPLKQKMSISQLGVFQNFKNKIKNNLPFTTHYLAGKSSLQKAKIHYVDIWLPKEVRSLTVQTEMSSYIGVQAFNSLNSQLNFSTHQNAQALGLDDLKVFQDLVSDTKSNNDIYKSVEEAYSTNLNSIKSAVQLELKNSWLPFISDLQNQHSIESQSMSLEKTDFLSKRESNSILNSKIISSSALNRLKLVSKTSFSKDKKIRKESALEKANLLIQLEEYGVFERFVKKSLRLLNDPLLFQLLERYYEKTSQYDKAFRISAFMTFQDPSLENIESLFKYSIYTKKAPLSLRLAKLLYFYSSQKELLAQSILITKNLDFFEALKNKFEISPELIDQLQVTLNIDNGIKDSRLYNSKDYKILKRLRSGRTNLELINDWADNKNSDIKTKKVFQNINLPGERDTISLTTNIKNKLRLHHSERKTPVNLQLIGPKTYLISIRPLHKKSNDLISDWINININGTKDLNWPVIENKASFSLHNLENSQLGLPGNQERFLLKLPVGVFNVKLKSKNSPFLYEVKEQTNFIQSPILPPYNLSTFDFYTKTKESEYCKHQSAGVSTYTGSKNSKYKKFRGNNALIRSELCQNSNLNRSLQKIFSFIQKSRENSPKILPYNAQIEELSTAELETFQEILELLYLYEKNPRDFGLVSKAEYILQSSSKKFKSVAKPLWLQFRLAAGWQKFDNLLQDDGIWIDENPKIMADSYESELTKSLAGVTLPSTQLMSSGQVLHYKTRYSEPKFVQVEAVLTEPSVLKTQSVKIIFSKKGNKNLKQLTLSEKYPRKFVRLKIAPGENFLKIKFPKAARGQYIKINTSLIGEDGGVSPLTPIQEKTYHIATKQRPIKVRVEGPTVLKHYYKDMPLDQHLFHHFGPGSHSFTISARPQETQSYVRVFHLIKKDALDYNTRMSSEPMPVKEAKVTESVKTSNSNFNQIHELKIPHQKYGTISSHYIYNSRILTEDPLGGFIKNENYAEAGLTYRKKSDLYKLYYRAKLIGRARQFGHASLGLSHRITKKLQPSIHSPPISFWFENRNFYQRFTEVDPAKDLMSTHNTIAFAQHRQITQSLTHYPQIDAFYRLQSRKHLLSTNRIYVDQDLFTGYRNQHRWGLGIGDSLTWQPTWDFFLRFGVKYVTNENLANGELLRAKFTWAQNFKNLELNFNFTHTKYLDFDPGAQDRTSWLNTKLIYDWWTKNQERLEMSASFSWSPLSKDTSFLIGVSYNLNNGRGFTDFYPGERNFKGLKQRLAPKYNLIQYGNKN